MARGSATGRGTRTETTPAAPAEPAAPLVGAAAVVRGTVAHVVPGGSVCLATPSGFLWVSPDDVEIAAAPPDDGLFD